MNDRYRKTVAAAVLTLLAACGAPTAIEPQGHDESQLLSPGPGDFVALPCLGVPADAQCAIVLAGGKALLFGAPAGAFEALLAAGIDAPDAVFLFALEGGQIEGLMRLRNQSWIGGRQSMLPVAGPEGTALFVAHLDKAVEQADARTYVRRRPAGRLGAALLAPVALDGVAPAPVFDSGDLKVLAIPSASGTVHYRVHYGGQTLALLACPSGTDGQAVVADRVLACPEGADGEPDWPLAPPGLVIAEASGAVSPP